MASSVVGMWAAYNAWTWSCSTSRFTIASDRPGSPPSSTWKSRTGCPATPPRALTSATQARAPSAMGAIAAPITPDSAPTEPSRISPLGAPLGGGTGPGPGNPPAAEDPAGAFPAPADGFAPADGVAAPDAVAAPPAARGPPTEPDGNGEPPPTAAAGPALEPPAAEPPAAPGAPPAADEAVAPGAVAPDATPSGAEAPVSVGARPRWAAAALADSAPPVRARLARPTREPQPATRQTRTASTATMSPSGRRRRDISEERCSTGPMSCHCARGPGCRRKR